MSGLVTNNFDWLNHNFRLLKTSFKLLKRPITIKDIAQKLNMSVSTVSKALNNDKAISTLTKQRVQELAKEWKYVPNDAARNFKQSKSFTIGVIIPDLMDQSYVMVINGIEKAAVKARYNVITTQSHENPELQENIVNTLISHRVDGIILSVAHGTTDMSVFERFDSVGIPVVYIARKPKDEHSYYVTSRNADGAFEATEFLIKKGHKKIAHLKGPADMYVSNVRQDGYKQALEENGIPYNDDLVRSINLSVESVHNCIDYLMHLNDRPTAILAYKTYNALDAIKYINEKYPKLKNSIDIIGFGNLSFIQYLDNKPTASVQEDSEGIGQAATEMLLKIISNTSEEEIKPNHILLPCKLVIYN